MSLMSPDFKSLTVNFNVCTWGATYREGLKTEWEGAIKYF